MLDAQGNLYIQWVSRVPDVSGIGKRTGHTTLKNAKEKSLSPKDTPQMKYRTTVMALQNYLSKDTTALLCIQIIQQLSHFSRKKNNTTSLSARDSILMNCRCGLECRFFKHGPYNLICKSHKYTAHSQPHIGCTELQWLLVRRLVTTLPGQTEPLATSAD